MRLVLNIILCLLTLPVTSYAVSGNGSISSEIYSFEEDSLTHYQFYQSLQSRLNLYNNGNRQIGLSTYGRWRTDFDNKLESDPQLFIYDLQLNFKEFVKSSKITVGRYFVYSTVGSALIDGIRIKSTTIPKSEIDVNIGSEVNRLEPDKIQNLSENLIAGLRYQYKFDKSIKIGLNWFLRNSDNQVTTNKAGIDVSKRFNSFSVYSRVTYNISLISLNDILIRGNYSSNKWYFSVEGRYREPLVNSNTIFAIIDSDKYKRSRLEIQYKFNNSIRIISQLRYALYEDENSFSGSLGIRTTNFSLIYNHQNGRGTENNGFSGSLQHKLNRTTSLYASANLSRYKIQDSFDDLSDAYSTAVGLTRVIHKSWLVRGEWQYLRNAVESSNSRVYLRISKQFSFR